MRKFEAIRTEIKTLSGLQKELKIKRSNEKAIIEKFTYGTYESFPIAQSVQKNKYELRHLFQAYAILRGIERPPVKKPSNYNGVVIDQKKVDEMVEKFKTVEV